MPSGSAPRLSRAGIANIAHQILCASSAGRVPNGEDRLCTIWYMKHSTTIDTSASQAQTWQAVIDVTSWPQWTDSMTSIELLDGAPLRVGSRARVRQPKLPTTIYEVSEFREGEEFTWVARSPGVRTTGRHILTPNPDGTIRITLEVDWTGPLALVINAFLSGLTKRYLGMEAAGLRNASLDAGATTTG